MHWFIDPIKHHYADFKGRASRKVYWMFMLFYTLITLGMATVILLTGVFSGDIEPNNFGAAELTPAAEQSIVLLLGLVAIFMIFILAITIPLIALQVRRLHDTGRTGWWYLIGFVPYIGSLVLLVFSCLPSEPGTNRWGENPYGVGMAPESEAVPE